MPIAITDIIQSVYTVTKAIYNQVQLAKANKSQCQRLLERINIVVDSVRKLNTITHAEEYRSGLEALDFCLKNCSNFIGAHSNDASWFKQVLKAGTASERFKELNEELQKSIQTLSLGLNAQQIVNHEQDKKDQASDHFFISQKQDEIIKLNQKANAALQELKVQQTEQNVILLDHLASIKAQIAIAFEVNRANRDLSGNLSPINGSNQVNSDLPPNYEQSELEHNKNLINLNNFGIFQNSEAENTEVNRATAVKSLPNLSQSPSGLINKLGHPTKEWLLAQVAELEKQYFQCEDKIKTANYQTKKKLREEIFNAGIKHSEYGYYLHTLHSIKYPTIREKYPEKFAKDQESSSDAIKKPAFSN